MEIIQPNTTAILKCDSPLIPKMYKEGNTAVIQCGVPDSVVVTKHNNDNIGLSVVATGLILLFCLVACITHKFVEQIKFIKGVDPEKDH